MDDEIGPAGGEPATGPGGSLPTRRSRAPRWAAIAGVCAVAVTALVAAVAVAMGDDDASAGARTALAEMAPTRAQEGEGDGDGGHQDGHRAPADGARPGHRHEPRPPYEQRYGEATADEQQAADELLASVRATLAAYADVDAAVAAGYQAPVRPRGPTVHYLDPTVAEEGRVLDPARPNGLIYRTDPAGAPVLLGAFFVAPPGAPAPSPAGDLVVWHSHDPACPAFFATADEPCTEARRMLHVWTADRVELETRRRGPVEVEVTDPFGTPFRASIALAG